MSDARIMMQVGDAVRPLAFGRRAPPPSERSASTSWHGVPFEVHALGPVGEIGESGPPPGERGLLIVTRGRYETLVRGPAGDTRRHARAGSVQLLSGDERPYVLGMTGEAEVAAVHLSPEWLELLPRAPETLRAHGPVSGGRTLRALIGAMRDEVARGCRGRRLYAESLSLALLSYVAGLVPERAEATLEGLDTAERARLVDYIDAHLDHDLRLDTLAALVGMGRRRFTARFRASFGTSPYAYVIRTRLDRAARLISTGHDIAEVALRTGFSNQSHFTTAFRRAYGETPHRYARAHRTVVGRA